MLFYYALFLAVDWLSACFAFLLERRALGLALVAVSSAVLLPPGDVLRNDQIGGDGDPWSVGGLGKTGAQSHRRSWTVNPCYGRFGEGDALGDGDAAGDGVSSGCCCSDAGMRDGSGESGDECKWIAFQPCANRLNTNVMRPVAVSGVPLEF